MAGIYIHIPFCKKRCTYCDFYTEVAPRMIPSLVETIVKELYKRKAYLQNSAISTIYFGGGTPSILNKEQFSTIFNAISDIFNIDINAEITFEANPDDLTPGFMASLAGLPFNRISIGIQSFDDNDLKRINRRHTGREAIQAVKAARAAGFDNISIDLIYGLPYQTLESWTEQLEKAMSLGVEHISAYGLTYEEGTVLWKQRENGELETVDDETMNEMYELLLRKTKEHGFEAYEISNFAKSGYRSRHNTSYWRQEPYLGVGPSAHSFDIKSRQWNVSSITGYINALDSGNEFFEREELSLFDRYNDYVMVSLRTMEGLDLAYLQREFGPEITQYCLNQAEQFISTDKMNILDGKISLTTAGIQISNLILIQLMKV